jgi:hypothetical protein
LVLLQYLQKSVEVEGEGAGVEEEGAGGGIEGEVEVEDEGGFFCLFLWFLEALKTFLSCADITA